MYIQRNKAYYHDTSNPFDKLDWFLTAIEQKQEEFTELSL